MKGRYPCGQNMAEHQRAWERQSDSRQWDKPEGDDPVTLYRMMKTSVERFSDQPLFGYVPAEGMPRSHLSYGEFADLVDAVASGMVSRGVVAGDRIALIVDNSVVELFMRYIISTYMCSLLSMCR